MGSRFFKAAFFRGVVAFMVSEAAWCLGRFEISFLLRGFCARILPGLSTHTSDNKKRAGLRAGTGLRLGECLSYPPTSLVPRAVTKEPETGTFIILAIHYGYQQILLKRRLSVP